MKGLTMFVCFLLTIHVFSIEVKKIGEGVFTEKYSNSDKLMKIKNGILYSVNERSLVLHQIVKDKLIQLSEINLRGGLYSLDIYCNYAIVATTPPENNIYKIDISDVYGPKVIDTIKISGSYTGFIFQGKYCISELVSKNEWKLRIFNIIDFSKYSTINIPHKKWPVGKINDDVLAIISNNFIELYTLSEKTLTLVARHFVKELSYPRKATMLNDSILIHSCELKGFSVYNISNPFAWDLVVNIQNPISNYVSEGNDLTVLQGGHKILKYDISELKNPVLNSSINLNEKIYDIEAYENQLIIACKEGKIILYKDNIDEYILQAQYSNYGYVKDAVLYNDNLIVSTALGYTIKAKRIENKISVIDRIKDNNRKLFLRNNNEYSLSYSLLNKSDASITDVIQIDQEGLLLIHKDIYNLPDNVAMFSKYIIYLNMGWINIITLDNPRSLAAQMKFAEIREGRFYFYDDNIFLIGNMKGYVFNFDESKSTINIISEFNIYNDHFSNVSFYGNYMFISQLKGDQSCNIYDISDLTNIELFETINYTGSISVDPENGILFLGDYSCKAYDLHNIDNHNIKFLSTITNFSPIVKIFTSKEENLNYLWLVGETSVCLYSYDVKAYSNVDLGL